MWFGLLVGGYTGGYDSLLVTSGRWRISILCLAVLEAWAGLIIEGTIAMTLEMTRLSLPEEVSIGIGLGRQAVDGKNLMVDCWVFA